MDTTVIINVTRQWNVKQMLAIHRFFQIIMADNILCCNLFDLKRLVQDKGK